ncbi:PepSY-associated TM helix domain-containing protein [Mucilaginibacter gossypii]|uniref:PepSY-associated TM helix domain-containing protein n=1 Tax=Mucilaginibacter gossypii TaxID=551996 RepID=UPI000DCC8783|nr:MULTISPECIES: PepSY-associated TM helix domain-containing protein [Mucilaginibacter]QTE36423.1 PepSY-associated TM helix domain-containing protein [Mucilaginibacter gossypii]RAV55915.1 PepSY domain-containing protein [Mucilaginibacter rubeus]
MTPFKKTLLFIHRWLGFISGLVVFIVSITGCIFCFQDEIQDAIHSYRKVEVQNKPYIAPSILKAEALKGRKGAIASYVYYYGIGRPAGVLVTDKKEGLLFVYLNPYTGKITHIESPTTNFFIIVEYIHLYLLLPANIGTLIAGISVIVFVVLMITGIILWWPKRKSDRKRSFTIKWGGRWRRINYDLHNVLGFYATSVAIILAITGLSISFDWMREAIYTAANWGKAHPEEKVVFKSDSLLNGKMDTTQVINKAYLSAKAASPNAEMFLIYDDAAKAGTIGVTAYAQALHYYKSDSYSFDKYTGKLLNRTAHEQKSTGMKMNNMNYDIHVGQILGLPGKIIAFLASLICASLPITGFIIWLGKRKKSKSKKVKSVAHRRTARQHLPTDR